MVKEKKTSQKKQRISPVKRNTENEVDTSYAKTLEHIKSDIRQSQLRAALSVTQELTMLYWRTGKMILERIAEEGWGSKTIENLSRDIVSSFPDISGFSVRNLKYMRQFAESYPDENWATAVAQIPWGHNVDHIQKFLIELGHGFAFVGRQYRLEVGGEDSFIDLLFYHLKLRCYFVIELKAGKFDPRDAGQMNFYLSAVDDLLRHKDDNPTIGIIICKEKNSVKAEYALRDIKKPIGVSSYQTQIVKSLPKDLKASLPTIEEIEAELSKGD